MAKSGVQTYRYLFFIFSNHAQEGRDTGAVGDHDHRRSFGRKMKAFIDDHPGLNSAVFFQSI
ncbi:hypothetical protein FQZ97_1253060 [compost metagenome]